VSDSVEVTLARIEEQLTYIKRDIEELKQIPRTPAMPVLPVTGGIVGTVAAVWVAYLQATGQA
jgi:hypothetical protein